MFGGGMNPRKLQQMMEQMGIDVDEVDAREVRIETRDGEVLVFDQPEVTQMEAQGQRTFQIVGDPSTEEATVDEGDADIPEEDVELVIQRTGVDADVAREALEASDGDLAAAITRLS